MKRDDATFVETVFIEIEKGLPKVGDIYSDGSLRNARWLSATHTEVARLMYRSLLAVRPPK